jgi:hypothetical protein
MRTDSSPPRARGAQHAVDAVQAREAGLRLVSRAQRWIAVLAVGAASGLAAVTAHAYHARAAPSPVTSIPPAQRAADDGSDSSGSTAPAASIQPPPAAPAPAASTDVAPVVSGGS